MTATQTAPLPLRAPTAPAPLALEASAWPSVSVIIPCRNEARSIRHCLWSVLESDFPLNRLEILVVDGCSDDGTREVVADVARTNPCVRLLDNPARTTPAALNIGIRASRSDVVVRLDAHTEYDPSYLRTVVAGLEQYGADNVGGVCESRPQVATPLGRALALSLTHRFGVGNSTFRVGSGAPAQVDTVPFGCWKRSTFERVGLFDERLLRNQDLEMNARLRRTGGKVVLLPEARSTYYARSRFREAWRHNESNGFWVTYGWLRYRSPASWRHTAPAAFVTGWVALAALALTGRPRPLLVTAAGYASAVVGASAHAAVRAHDPKAAPWLPVAFGGLHVSYGIGSLKGVVRGLREGRDRTTTEPRRAR